jgi:hypothetical protein
MASCVKGNGFRHEVQSVPPISNPAAKIYILEPEREEAFV